MIAHLTGKIINRTSSGLIIDVSGVGYWVDCTHSFLKNCQLDQEISVYTHQYVREDEVSLYGFETLEQLQLFRHLISISGIGPRLAIGIIDRAEPEEIIKAIGREDLSFFTTVPGIGKKNAARIVLELKTKLTDQAISGLPSEPETGEVVDALRSLGFVKKEILPVIQDLPSDWSLEKKVKETLKRLSHKG